MRTALFGESVDQQDDQSDRSSVVEETRMKMMMATFGHVQQKWIAQDRIQKQA